MRARFAAWLLCAGLAACAAPASVPAPGGGALAVAETDFARERVSRSGRYQLRFDPVASPVPFNRIHSWLIELRDVDGEPVEGARIRFDGGMPDHDHGFPTEPRVTREVAPGVYRVDGVRFGMQGWWQFKLIIEHAGTLDEAQFNLMLGPGG